MSIQLPEAVGIDTNNAYGNNVSNANDCSSNTGNSMKCLGRVCCVRCVVIYLGSGFLLRKDCCNSLK